MSGIEAGIPLWRGASGLFGTHPVNRTDRPYTAYPVEYARARDAVEKAARRYREASQRALPFETQQTAFVDMSNALTALDALAANGEAGNA